MVQQLAANSSLAMLNDAPVGVILASGNGQVQWLNRTMEAFLAIEAEQLLNKSVDDLTPDHLKPLPEEQFMVMIPARAGRIPRYCKVYTTPMGEATGDEQSQAFYFVDVSDVKEERDQLAQQVDKLTINDKLTGLPTKHAALRSMEPLVALSRRYGNPLSVILIELGGLYDLDEPQQEKTLIKISQMLKDQMRWVDQVGRYDYSQFLLVLPQTDSDSAIILQDKITAQLDQLGLTDNPQLEIKLGLAGWSKGDDIRSLIAKAAEKCKTEVTTPII